MIGFRAAGFGLGFALAGALPAFAQVPNCGGAGAAGTWVGGIEAASDVSVATQALDISGSAARNGEIVTLFRVSQAGTIRVEAMPGDGQDTVIDLISDTGAFLASDDDGGGGLASRSEVFLEPGSYCLLTRGLGGDAVDAQIRIGREDHVALTSGGMIDQAPVESCAPETPAFLLSGVPMSAGSQVRLSNVSSRAMTPFYRFETDGSLGLTITANNETADPVLYLYDETGVLVAENDDFDGLNSRIDLETPLPAGLYCIALAALSDETAPITLEVSEFNQAEYLAGLYDRGEAAPPLDGSYPVTDLGVLANRARQDVRVADGVASWFSVEMPEGGVLLVEAIALADADPVLTMFDDLGRQVGMNDDNGEGFDSLLAVRAQPGTYIIALTLLGEGGGAVRLALERFIRVP